MNTMLTAAVLETFQPPLVPFTPNLTGVLFPLMKVFPAAHALDRARAEGQLADGDLVVESSSGTMALGLAIVCALRRQRLTIVSDYACDDALRRRLIDLGAVVEIVPAPAASGGYQRARLDRLAEIRRAEPRHFWVNQYDNPANADAYTAIADRLIDAAGRIDCVVGTVGSGGSMCGLGRRLRERLTDVTLIGVDTFGSVLFGLPDGPRTLRGLGNSLLPGNLDHALFDEVHWVTAAEAYTATRLLHRRTALFRGGTSGAAWLVARYWAAAHPRARVLCLCPDEGHRYVETIHDDRYLHAHGLWLDELPAAPRIVDAPRDAAAEQRWASLAWARRTHADATGACLAAPSKGAS